MQRRKNMRRIKVAAVGIFLVLTAVSASAQATTATKDRDAAKNRVVTWEQAAALAAQQQIETQPVDVAEAARRYRERKAARLAAMKKPE